jgi:general secretion pathway protein G
MPLLAFGSFVVLFALGAASVYMRMTQRHMAELDLRNLQQGLELFHRDHGRFPTTQEGLHALVRENIFERTPRDPWDAEYIYRLEDDEPVIMTLGADRMEGGRWWNEDLSVRGSAQ